MNNKKDPSNGSLAGTRDLRVSRRESTPCEVPIGYGPYRSEIGALRAKIIQLSNLRNGLEERNRELHIENVRVVQDYVTLLQERKRPERYFVCLMLSSAILVTSFLLTWSTPLATALYAGVSAIAANSAVFSLYHLLRSLKQPS